MEKADTFTRCFFEEHDVVFIAKELLGAEIETVFNGQKTAGIITETEAYRAPEDKASHAYNFRRTNRNEVMYGMGGMAYVYLCYGIHHLFNVVTGPVNTPHAVLIRAIEPTDGVRHMLTRRKLNSNRNLTNGPGKWTKAFGITTEVSGIDLLKNNQPIRIRPADSSLKKEFTSSPRIGIDYAEEWVNKLWRFNLSHQEDSQ